MNRKTADAPLYVRVEGDIAYVELTQGKTAIIDATDAPLVSGCLWRAHHDAGHWYAATGARKSWLFLHRLLLGSEADGLVVDHIDGDGLNNRRSNLRACTIGQNLRNSKKKRTGTTSRFKGVSKKSKRTWRASIRSHGAMIHIGTYRTEELAAKAYDRAAVEHFGQFARTNF